MARITRITRINIFYLSPKKISEVVATGIFYAVSSFFLSHMLLAWREDLFPPCLNAILAYTQRREEIFALVFCELMEGFNQDQLRFHIAS